MKRQLASLLPWRQTEHTHLASRGVEDAGQHFDRGGLARTIWPYESQYFPCFQGKADLLDGFSFAVLGATNERKLPASPAARSRVLNVFANLSTSMIGMYLLLCGS